MSETPSDLPDIRLAKLEDFTELQGLLDRANEYSVDQSGLPAWRAMDHVYGGLRGHVERAECFVANASDGAISSAICLSETTDEIWGEAGKDAQALYFTKLIKDPLKGGPGAGRVLLNFAAAEALRRHKSLLRCDTVTELQGLIDYYLRLGFEHKGEFVYASTGRAGVLLEAPVAALLDKQEP